MNADRLKTLAKDNGLVFRGGFIAAPDELLPPQDNGDVSLSLLMFGQAGNSLWPVFSQSPELADNQTHPMDRWSQRVGQSLANTLGGRLLLPFGDAPYHPFLQWAKRTEDVQPSRLGLLIHPDHGLWHAYRFAIALSEPVSGLAKVESRGNICGQCETQACLNVCPVNAFDAKQYDVKACFEYLEKHPEAICNTKGCMARDACPEGPNSHYALAQKQFHMQQFTLALHNRFK